MKNYFKNSHHQVTSENDAKLAGRMAAMLGRKDLLENPYKEGTSLHNAWETGFVLYKLELIKQK